jgi:phosphoglycolate phosphatase
MLDAVARKGAVAWVVTSKPEHYAVGVIRDLKIDGFFQGVVGAGLDETDTKGQLIARALAAAHVNGKEAIMLGDRFYDVVGALENNVLPVGALWGYGSYEELHAAGCRHFAASPREFCTRFVEAEIFDSDADRHAKRGQRSIGA